MLFFIHPKKQGCKYCGRREKQNDTASARLPGCAAQHCGKKTKTNLYCGERGKTSLARGFLFYKHGPTQGTFEQQTFLLSPLRNLERALAKKVFDVDSFLSGLHGAGISPIEFLVRTRTPIGSPVFFTFPAFPG